MDPEEHADPMNESDVAPEMDIRDGPFGYDKKLQWERLPLLFLL